LQGEPVGHALEYLAAGLCNGKAIAEHTFRIDHRPFVDGGVGRRCESADNQKIALESTVQEKGDSLCGHRPQTGAA
jgi:hypothetical protein